MQIAFRHIAERGFEGLRISDVARAAGINNATLVYHFPTKEALIQGVATSLVEDFATGSVAPEEGDTPVHELRREFEDIRYRLQHTPQVLVVLTELWARSLRDPLLAQVLQQMDAAWRTSLVNLLERGRQAGVFRRDLVLETAATGIMASIKGVGLQSLGRADMAHADALISQLADQTERWLSTTDL